MTPEEKAEKAKKVREISLAVYKIRLVQDSGKGAVERMMSDDGDDGEKINNRAAAYDPLTRAYLQALKIEL